MNTCVISQIRSSKVEGRVSIRSNSVDAKGNLILPMAYYFPLNWLLVELQKTYGITSLKEIQLSCFKGMTVNFESMDIVPAGTIFEGSDKPSTKDSLDLKGFNFEIERAHIKDLRTIKEDLGYSEAEWAALPLAGKITVTSAAPVVVTAAAVAAGISEDEE